MEKKLYEVSRIEGEYAYLRDLSGECTEELFIALALLPFGTDVGKRLEYEFPEYTLIS